jgi:hypothetical protein
VQRLSLVERVKSQSQRMRHPPRAAQVAAAAALHAANDSQFGVHDPRAPPPPPVGPLTTVGEPLPMDLDPSFDPAALTELCGVLQAQWQSQEKELSRTRRHHIRLVARHKEEHAAAQVAHREAHDAETAEVRLAHEASHAAHAAHEEALADHEHLLAEALEEGEAPPEVPTPPPPHPAAPPPHQPLASPPPAHPPSPALHGLREIALAGNALGPEGAALLAPLVRKSRSIRSLDLSDNCLAGRLPSRPLSMSDLRGLRKLGAALAHRLALDVRGNVLNSRADAAAEECRIAEAAIAAEQAEIDAAFAGAAAQAMLAAAVCTAGVEETFVHLGLDWHPIDTQGLGDSLDSGAEVGEAAVAARGVHRGSVVLLDDEGGMVVVAADEAEGMAGRQPGHMGHHDDLHSGVHPESHHMYDPDSHHQPVLKSLNLSDNALGPDGGQVLAAVLAHPLPHWQLQTMEDDEFPADLDFDDDEDGVGEGLAGEEKRSRFLLERAQMRRLRYTARLQLNVRRNLLGVEGTRAIAQAIHLEGPLLAKRSEVAARSAAATRGDMSQRAKWVEDGAGAENVSFPRGRSAEDQDELGAAKLHALHVEEAAEGAQAGAGAGALCCKELDMRQVALRSCSDAPTSLRIRTSRGEAARDNPCVQHPSCACVRAPLLSTLSLTATASSVSASPAHRPLQNGMRPDTAKWLLHALHHNPALESVNGLPIKQLRASNDQALTRVDLSNHDLGDGEAVSARGVVRCGAVRCGAVRCGAVRCGAVRCGCSVRP